MPIDFSEQLADLKDDEQRLLQELRLLQEKLSNTRRLIASIEAHGKSTDVRRKGTYDIIREYVATLPPGSPVKIGRLMQYAETHGWYSRAIEPRTSITGAMAQLAASGRILIRTAHGEYRSFTDSEMRSAIYDA